MRRNSQSEGSRGSKRHLQRLVNLSTDPLGERIRRLVKFDIDEEIIWRSPLSEEYFEYSDGDFLEVLGLQETTMRYPLTEFWPRLGPCWDALAQSNKGRIILVEAKSHIHELSPSGDKGDCRAKDPASMERIRESLKATKSFFGSRNENDWTKKYYQYANRLAHVYWFRVLNGIDTHLVYVYFINDFEMKGPQSIVEWESEIARVHAYLGLNTLPFYVHSLFFDVASELS